MSGPLVVFGAGGQLGREVLALGTTRRADVLGFTRQDVDITDADAVARAIRSAKPRLILNAAAYTAVDKAESEPERAAAINAAGAGLVARAAAAAAVPLLHVSTDYVFDGTKACAYLESDPIAPLGVYGRTKAEGEGQVRQATPRHIVLRTAWVYGRYGSNFLKTMLRLAPERSELRVVADQRGCPTSTTDLAEAVFAIDTKLANGSSDQMWGTYHFAGTGVTSWYAFAEAIIAAQAELSGCRPHVTAITTAEYPTPARRPANSALDSSRFVTEFGYAAMPWQTRTIETVSALLQPAPAL